MKKPTRTALKKKLWKLFSAYIRKRDPLCFTCGRPGTQAGHYIPAAACGADMYFSEINVNSQCFFCNCILEGNHHIYRKRLIQKYGLKVVEEIENTYHIPNPSYPYEEWIEYYENEKKTHTSRDNVDDPGGSLRVSKRVGRKKAGGPPTGDAQNDQRPRADTAHS